MKTELVIRLNTKDCEKIFKDLEQPIGKVSGLSPEVYLLYNKIKGFIAAYSDIEEGYEEDE